MSYTHTKAIVRYQIDSDEKIVDCFTLDEIENLQNVDKIRKITFYSEAVDYIFDKFKNVPGRRDDGTRDYVTYTGDMAHFIIYNW